LIIPDSPSEAAACLSGVNCEFPPDFLSRSLLAQDFLASCITLRTVRAAKYLLNATSIASSDTCSGIWVLNELQTLELANLRQRISLSFPLHPHTAAFLVELRILFHFSMASKVLFDLTLQLLFSISIFI
jgi:hypothetical protein